MALHHWIDTLRLWDVHGREICSGHVGAADPDLNERDFFKKIVQGDDFAVRELALNPRSGIVGMNAAAPVIQHGALVGVISAGIRPDVFEERSPIRIDPELNINMFVLNRNGTLIAHFPPLDRSIAGNPRESPVVQSMLMASAGAFEARDLIGVPRLFASRSLPEVDAILAVGVHRDLALGAIDEVLRYRLVLITLILGGCLLLGMLGVESFVFRPLRDLVHTAEALEHGRVRSRVPPKGAGEVRILARALNRMADAIAEREHELTAAKEVAEGALSQANIASQAKTDFLAAMSHEIRTP